MSTDGEARKLQRRRQTTAVRHEDDLAVEEARGFADQVPIDGWEQRPPDLSRELILSQNKEQVVDYTKGRLLTRQERGEEIEDAGGKRP